MIEYLKKQRALALTGALVIIGLCTIGAIGYLVHLVWHDEVSLSQAARRVGPESISLMWIFVAVILVLVCVLTQPPLSGRQKLVKASAIVVGIAAVVTLIFWVMTLFSCSTVGTWLSAVGGMIEILVKFACTLFLWRLSRRAALKDDSVASSKSLRSSSDGKQASQSPNWAADHTMGFQWGRAGDAATGDAPVSHPSSAQGLTADMLEEPKPRRLWARGGMSPEALSKAGRESAILPERSAGATDQSCDAPAPDQASDRSDSAHQGPDWSAESHNW